MTAVDIFARRRTCSRPALTDAELTPCLREGVLRIDVWLFCADGVDEQLVFDKSPRAAPIGTLMATQ